MWITLVRPSRGRAPILERCHIQTHFHARHRVSLPPDRAGARARYPSERAGASQRAKRRQLLREEACRMKSNWRARELSRGCESGSGEGGMNGSELARAVPVIDL